MHFRFPRLVGFQLRPILAQLFDDFLTDSELFHIGRRGTTTTPNGVLRAASAVAFRPAAASFFRRHRVVPPFPAVVVYLHALFLFSGRRRRRRRRREDDDVLSSDKCRPFFPPPRRQKSATQSIYARERFSPHPFTSLLLKAKNKKRESKFRRQKRGVARNRRTRERDAVALLFDDDVFLSMVVRASFCLVFSKRKADKKKVGVRQSRFSFFSLFFL